MEREPTLEVSEIFGPTLQGEGLSIGTPSIFLRLRRCNLSCVWCDTKYTWDKKDPGYSKFDVLTVSEVARLINPRYQLVITGGEPLIWKLRLTELVRNINNSRIEIETNGTVSPTLTLLKDERVHFNVSPKLKSAQTHERALKIDPMLDRVVFKFVVSDEEDFEGLLRYIDDYRIDKKKVLVMPQGISVAEVAERHKKLWDLCAEHDLRMTTRLHVLAFGDERGV